MMKQTGDRRPGRYMESRISSSTGAKQEMQPLTGSDRKIYESFQEYLKKSTALGETGADRMDRERILLRMILWKLENKEVPEMTDEFWEKVSRGYGDDRIGKLISGMNGTLITYDADEDEEIRITDLGMKVIFNTIRGIHHNCPL